MKKNIAITIFLAFFISMPIGCFAANFSDLVINEIAWMGTAASANDEWIELYNNSDSPINLEGWTLIAEDGAPKDIQLTGSILAKSFYLAERTDDNSVPNIAADLIYTGALGNNGENLKLYDNFGNLIDEINCKDGWLAGDNKTKQTMERAGASAWQTSAQSGGTPKSDNSIVASGQAPKSQNSAGINSNAQTPTTNQIPNPNTQNAEGQEQLITPQNSSELAISSSPAPLISLNPPQTSPIVAPTYPDGIVFNEILPSPEGSDAENEWIEIFNQNNFEVDLSDWKIKDSQGAIATYSFPEGTKIPGLGYLVIGRKESKITMNNDKDSLTIIRPDGKIIDSVSYEKAPLGQSYNKTRDNWQWSGSPTPGAKNSMADLSAETKDQPSAIANSEQKGVTAALIENLPAPGANQNKNSQTENNLKNYIPASLIALFIAIFSGISILFLKKKMTPESWTKSNF